VGNILISNGNGDILDFELAGDQCFCNNLDSTNHKKRAGYENPKK
jgi:hypothetical protein